MIALDVELRIARGAGAVYAALSDFAAVPHWQRAILRCAAIPDGAPHVGQRVVETRRFLGMRMENTAEVVTVEADRRLGFRSLADAAQQFESGYELTPHGEETVLRFRLHMESKRLAFRLAAPLLRYVARQDAARRFQRLKELLERNEFSSPP